MKLTGYTRYSDSVLKKNMKRYIRGRGGVATISTFGNPLCDVDSRRCSQRGELKKGSCANAYASLVKAGPCRRVEVEYFETVIVKTIEPGGGK